MTNQVIIIGAGLAGLLAANMLRRSAAVVLEAQPRLPNNHHAVLRFRTDKVALQTGIAFRKVSVHKAIHQPVNPVADALAYSDKVTGRLELRSVINTATSERFIAPSNLIELMADGLTIEYGRTLKVAQLVQEAVGKRHGVPLISTMPMPNLMDLLKYPGKRPTFVHHCGYVVKAKLSQSDVFATIYYPHSTKAYRASITGDELSIEIAVPDASEPAFEEWDWYDLIAIILPTFGLKRHHVVDGSVTFKTQAYAKIGRLSEEDRKLAHDFMYWATSEHNIYSLGRFATWRAGLLMDDVVDDVAKIEGWMRSGPYALRKDV